MRFGLVTAAALSLGVSVLVPSFASAEPFAPRGEDRPMAREVRPAPLAHFDHDDRYDRREHDGRFRDVTVTVIAGELPSRVVDAALREGNGRRVVGAQYVRAGGRVYYDVQMQRGGKQDLFLQITPDGDLVALGRGAQR